MCLRLLRQKIVCGELSISCLSTLGVATLLDIKGNSKEDLPLNLSWVIDLMGVLVNFSDPRNTKTILGRLFHLGLARLNAISLGDNPQEVPLKRVHLEV